MARKSKKRTRRQASFLKLRSPMDNLALKQAQIFRTRQQTVRQVPIYQKPLKTAVQPSSWRLQQKVGKPIQQTKTQTNYLTNIKSRATICARRKIRDEVLHAFNKTGKSGQTKQVNNENRNINCK